MKNNYKILHFDDSESLVYMYKLPLEEAGFKHKHFLSTPKDREDIIELVTREAPDCIIMDMMIPITPGVEAIDILKSNPGTKDIPILGLSNVSDVEEIQKAIISGVNDYIVSVDLKVSQLPVIIKDMIEGEHRELFYKKYI